MITKPPILDETGVKIKQAIIRIKNKFLGQDDSAVTPGSAASSGTAAVMQDDTGRDIISALNDLGDAVKPASTTDPGLVTTGAQTFAGNKAFAGDLKNERTSVNGPGLGMYFSDMSNAEAGRLLTVASDNGGRMYFREFCGDSSGVSSIFEQYRLPAPTQNRASSVTNEILTTKTVIKLNAAYYTTTSGYFSVNNASVNGNSVIIAQNNYFSAGSANLKYVFVVQPANGYFNVYVRDGSGNLPSDNTRFLLAFLIFN